MTNPHPLIDAQRISRRFGYRRVFSDVSIAVRSGDAVCLIGPNGAGKTTLLRVLAGLLKPSDGSVTRTGSVELVSHHSMLYDALTARENLRFSAALRGIADPDRIDGLLELVDLRKWADERIGVFSQGMRQRLALARGLLGQPDALLLDEPLSGLDEPGCRAIVALLRTLREEGRAMVLVTHQYDLLAPIVNAVRFLVRGELSPVDTGLSLVPADVSSRYHEMLGHG